MFGWNRITGRGRRALAAAAVLLALHSSIPEPARAQGGPAEAAAVAGVIVSVVGGLSSWLEKNSDDCATAAMGAAWGKDCSLTKEECTDTGFYSAYCSALGENSCGRGRGSASAWESGWGMWDGYGIDPYAFAHAKPLHNQQDSHGASAWGKAQVDGTSRAKSEETPPSRPQDRQDLLAMAPDRPVGARSASSTAMEVSEEWPEGAVVVVAFFDSLRLSANVGSPVGSWIRAKVEVPGSFVWEARVEIDASGSLTTTGGIPASSFALEFDPVLEQWNASLIDFRVEFAVDTLETALGVDSVDVPVHMEVELSAGDGKVAEFSPPPIPVTPSDLHMTSSDGVPLLNGRRVSVVTPLTAISGSAPFGPLLDLNVTDGDAHVGILDLFADADWQQGETRAIEATVTHHEGRTVLTDVQGVLVGSGPVPPPLEAPIEVLLMEAEQLEGRRVQLRDCYLVDAAQWPDSPKEIAVVRVQDPNGAQIDLEVLAPPDHVDGLAPMGSFHATGVLLQKDPDGSPYHSGYRIRLESIEETGTSEVVNEEAPSRSSMIAQPNPASQSTWIRYRASESGGTQLRVLDAQGRRVRDLTSGAAAEEAAERSTQWDLHDDRGNRVPAGIYFVHLASGDFHQTRKVTVMR